MDFIKNSTLEINFNHNFFLKKFSLNIFRSDIEISKRVSGAAKQLLPKRGPRKRLLMPCNIPNVAEQKRRN